MDKGSPQAGFSFFPWRGGTPLAFRALKRVEAGGGAGEPAAC